MAAPTTTNHTRSDNFNDGTFVFTAVFGSSQETAALKIDLSTLAYVDPATAGQTCTVESLKWNISGSGVVEVNLAGGSPVKVAELSGFGEIDGGNLSDAGGDLSFTTTGMASGDTYQVEIRILKAAGFCVVPAVTDITFDSTSAGPTFKAGDVITTTIDFAPDVFVNGQPQLEYVMTSGTVLATCTNESNAYASTLTFTYAVSAIDQADAGEFTVGDLVLNNSARLMGGFASGNARLTFSAPDTSTVNVNKLATAPTVALVAGTGPRYDSGETVSFTVTYNQNVSVTGVPTMAMVLTSGNKNASYASGSGTSTLTFSYSPVVSGDVSNSSTVSLTSPIVLNGGTIKDSLGRNPTLTFTPPSLTSVSFNHA